MMVKRPKKTSHSEADGSSYDYVYDTDVSYGGEKTWKPHVKISDQKRKAEEEILRQRKQGNDVCPVRSSAKTIAASFWGKAWCQNLQRYEDYQYRLPRGRSYLRNGCVVDLKIQEGEIQGLVRGEYLYEVHIKIQKADEELWTSLVERCSGQIESVVGLLAGGFPDSVMKMLIEPESGLFPQPSEIKMSCTCLDVADLCKHVAAALYGVGVVLDTKPELFFVLRGVQHTDLIKKAAEGFISSAAESAADFDVAAMEDLFGIDIDTCEL
jgi:uncharacterized Zn finger protein